MQSYKVIETYKRHERILVFLQYLIRARAMIRKKFAFDETAEEMENKLFYWPIKLFLRIPRTLIIQKVVQLLLD